MNIVLKKDSMKLNKMKATLVKVDDKPISFQKFFNKLKKKKQRGDNWYTIDENISQISSIKVVEIKYLQNFRMFEKMSRRRK